MRAMQRKYAIYRSVLEQAEQSRAQCQVVFRSCESHLTAEASSGREGQPQHGQTNNQIADAQALGNIRRAPDQNARADYQEETQALPQPDPCARRGMAVALSPLCHRVFQRIPRTAHCPGNRIQPSST